MTRSPTYIGIHKDKHGGLTDAGRIVRDAWVFSIIPEHETCEGWSYGQIQALYDRVAEAWEPYGQLVSNLPPELRERHQRLYMAAVQKARESGWNPSVDDEDE